MFLGSIRGSMRPLHQRVKTVNSAQVNKLIYNYNYVKMILLDKTRQLKLTMCLEGNISTKR